MNQIPVYDSKGKELEKLSIEANFSKDAEIGKIYSNIVRALRQNWRQGTVGCKGRSDLSFSNRKPWKQKGTGRARAGSLRSPLWRKGAVLFGPQPRTKELFFNKKQNKLVLNEIFADFVKNNKVYGLDFFLDDKPSTKSAFNALLNTKLNTKKIVLFLSFDNEQALASFRNLPNVNILCFDQPNAYDLSNAECWVFLKKDVELFKDMVSSWI